MHCQFSSRLSHTLAVACVFSGCCVASLQHACANFLAQRCWQPATARVGTLQPLYNTVVDRVADAKLRSLVTAAASGVQCDNALRFPANDELKNLLSAIVNRTVVTADAAADSAIVHAAASVVSDALGSFDSLSQLSTIPLLVTFYNWLHATFAHRVTQEEAIDCTVQHAIANLDSADRVRFLLIF
jgi:hypothetical protein